MTKLAATILTIAALLVGGATGGAIGYTVGSHETTTASAHCIPLKAPLKPLTKHQKFLDALNGKIDC